jgi:hypothetical protein
MTGRTPRRTMIRTATPTAAAAAAADSRFARYATEPIGMSVNALLSRM